MRNVALGQTIEDVPTVYVECSQFDATAEPERPPGMNPEFVFSPYSEGDADGACWYEPEHLRDMRRVGYCGLAGKPVGAAE